jgi:signal recognition particle subunit SRP54
MGDVLSLIEKAQAAVDLDKAKEMEEKLRKDTFTLDDFLEQLQQVRKLGSIEQILSMIPGMSGLTKKLEGAELDESELKRTEAIIRSMTRKERRDHTIINGSRRKRIATGSGTKVQDVNRLLKQYAEAKKMMKRLQDMQKSGKKLSGFRLPFMK